MNKKLKYKRQSIHELIKAVNLAPDHVLEIDTPYGSAEIRLKSLSNISRPPKRTKAQSEAVKQKIAALVTKNEQILKKSGLTVKDLLKTLPRVRADYNKKKYGMDPDAHV